MKPAPLALLLASLCACACAHEEPARAPDAGGGASTAKPEAGAPDPAAPRERSGPLRFSAPPGWVEEQPSSGMRVAQFTLPAAEGDPRDAQLVVYHFGTGGGSVEANLARWASQFELPGGGDPAEAMVRSERRVAGMPVHEVALEGTYVAETSPGSGQRVHEPGTRMLAAIVESDHGAYYVKLVGPERTVERWADSFRAYVSSAR